METTTVQQPLRSVAGLQSAAPSTVTAPSSTDPPNVMRALSGTKPGLDRVSISDEAQRMAAARDARAASGAGNNDRLESAGPRSMADRADSIMNELKARFFTRAGDENFKAKLDFNSDGMINVQDLGMLREKLASMRPPEPPASPNASVTTSAPAAATQTGPATSQSQVPADSTSASNVSEPATASSALTVESIRAAFFTRDGEDGFNAAADLNGDGVINVRDLGLLRQAQADTAEPTQPVPEPLLATGGSTPTPTSATGLTPEAPATASDGSNDASSATATPVVDPALTQEAETGAAATALPTADLRASLLDQLREAFFSQAGDDRFDATLDANGDGRINVADFVSVREEV